MLRIVPIGLKLID